MADSQQTMNYRENSEDMQAKDFKYSTLLTNRINPVEINGGIVQKTSNGWQMRIPSNRSGYCNAQLDDYRQIKRKNYYHRPGTSLFLEARFSNERDRLVGTAGFGFWNAALGDPTVPYPTWPQATWFFFASSPNHLPFGPMNTGRGWFASTIDAGRPKALAWIPVSSIVVLLNQRQAWQRRLWPVVRRSLGIRAEEIIFELTDWHQYRLDWRHDGCLFWVDEHLVLRTPFSPRGPLGFVCWIDNQYMIATATGRVGWGTIPVVAAQSLEIRHLQIMRIDV